MLNIKRGKKYDTLIVHIVAILTVSLLLVYDYYNTESIVEIRVKNPQFRLLGPYNSTKPNLVVDDVYEQLIDLKSFTFKMNPQPCYNYSAGLLLVVLISSNPIHYDNRMVIRNTWGRTLETTKVVFLIGESKNAIVSQKIQNESAVFGDIVQGSFTDAYRNMTYKHVMGLKWVAYYCPMAKYILKTDDDVVVNSHGLRHFLARELSPWGAKGLITCQVLNNSPVLRSPRSKWRVSPAEFAPNNYPTYCSGFAIIYSQDVVPRLLKAALSTPYFWIDDVYLTGMVAERIGVARTPLPNLILTQDGVKKLTTLGANYAGQFLFGPPNVSYVARDGERILTIPHTYKSAQAFKSYGGIKESYINPENITLLFWAVV